MANEVQPGLSPEELELTNKLIAVASDTEGANDQMVASAASALLAGAICGMLGLGGEDTTPEEYNQFAGYFHTRIEEFVLSLLHEATTPAPETN